MTLRIKSYCGEEKMKIYHGMQAIVEEQFALDYNCQKNDFENKETLVTIAKKQLGQRRFEETENFFSILIYNGKLVITANEALESWCREILSKKMTAEWGFEAQTLIMINEKLREFGYQIDEAHVYFLPFALNAEKGRQVEIIPKEDIPSYANDKRIEEAFEYEACKDDEIGTVIRNESGEILAVAGASSNSDKMWEIGIDSFETGKGYASKVVSRLAFEVWKLGRVPYYGTALSHLASQNVALRSGFLPAFCELRTIKTNC